MVCKDTESEGPVKPKPKLDMDKIAAGLGAERSRPCWLVGQDPDGRCEIVKARLVGNPVDGAQVVVRVGSGCGVLNTLPVEKVYLSREAAEKRLAELEDGRKG